MRERAYIGVGSNLGDRMAHCLSAVGAFDRLAETRVFAVSQWYETEPVGDAGQPWYLNGAVGVSTALSPRALLNACLAIERRRGRERSIPGGSRTLDLDLLLYGDLTVHESGLTIPHPRLTERAFVLIPLSDIAAATVHPELGVPIATLRARLTDCHAVTPYRPPRSVAR